MEPYYEDACVTIYHGDARELLPDALPTNELQVWLTDPPYSSGGFQEACEAVAELHRVLRDLG